MRLIPVPRAKTGCISYIIADGAAGTCLVVDPPEDPTAVLRTVDGLQARVVEVLETHTHADHVSGAHHVGQMLGVPVRLPSKSQATYSHRSYGDADALRVGDVEVRALHTPGHTADSMSLIVGGRALVGDALLVGTVGRGDFYPQGIEELYHSLFDKLLTFDDELMIYPAHFGPRHGLPERTSTTLGEERRTNEALNQKTKPEFVRYMSEGWPPKPQGWEEIVERNLKG
ncbi:MAG: MBL fold metallo-hydrolase [Thermoplasmata archaeon]|nr:MBL fold metallo-hydrolase [Thermoplasmata archaeon]